MSLLTAKVACSLGFDVKVSEQIARIQDAENKVSTRCMWDPPPEIAKKNDLRPPGYIVFDADRMPAVDRALWYDLKTSPLQYRFEIPEAAAAAHGLLRTSILAVSTQ